MEKQIKRRLATVLLPVLALLTAVYTPVVASDEIGMEVLGVAIDGYDPVAYFTQGQALKGSEAYTHFWNDAEWRFINTEHRELFVANPVKYAPRHGGF